MKNLTLSGSLATTVNLSGSRIGYLECDYVDLLFEQTDLFRMNLLAVAVVNIFTAVPIIAANALVILAFVRKHSLRRQGNKILISLTLADFSSGLIAQPCLISTLLLLYFRHSSDIPCSIVTMSSTAGYTLACVSLLTVSFVSFERYLAIFHPFVYSRTITTRVLIGVDVAIWIASIFMISLLLFLKRSNEFFWANAVVIGVTYVWNIYVYARITRQVMKIRRETHRLTKRFKSIEPPSKENATDAKVTKVAGSIIMALLICYLPQVVVSLWRAINDENRIVDRYLEYWAITFGLANAGLNPLFYCYYNSEIRQEVLEIIKSCKRSEPFLPSSSSVHTDTTEVNQHAVAREEWRGTVESLVFDGKMEDCERLELNGNMYNPK